MLSTEISSLTGGFNQQVMLQQQQSSMISQQFGGYAPNPFAGQGSSFGERMSSNTLGVAGKIGQGIMDVGSRFTGPLGWAGSYAIGQMSHGVQQQQELEANLRQSYNFRNQLGGRGFTGSEMSGMGSNFRQMSHQRGPAGEMASFEELGQLASNMGRMGMAEGVRSVKDFNEKFRQMLQTVKTVATELGTSLEEAQKMMVSLKGSGVFRNQGQFAGQLRMGALAGNMSVAEMTSAAQMGSQISRSIGGLGRAGAQAGVNTMTNIGSAIQSGVMSDEDIYNVTGLTGAEGRQAMAQTMMSGDASFFSRGRGRRVLASIAGKNGNINQGDVAAYMMGGVGTGDTMGMARKNLGNVGHANFIRNEGRLRGQALQAFGGLGRAVVARDWLEGRGMDLDENNDRNMLFFQRMFDGGVGRDEADQLVKMARNLPQLLEEQQESVRNDQFLRQLDQTNRKASPQEITKRLQAAAGEVNDSLRQMGASFYRSLSTDIDEFVGKLVGQVAQDRRSDVTGIAHQISRGGAGGERAMNQLGMVDRGAGGYEYVQELAGTESTRAKIFGNGTLDARQFGRYIGANSDRYREAGFDIDNATSVADVQSITDKANGMASGYRSSGTSSGISLANLQDLRIRMGTYGVNGSGDDFKKSMIAHLRATGSENVARSLESASPQEAGKILGQIATETKTYDLLGNRLPGLDMQDARGGKFSTAEARQQELGAWMAPNDVTQKGLSWGQKMQNTGKDFDKTSGWLADATRAVTAVTGGVAGASFSAGDVIQGLGVAGEGVSNAWGWLSDQMGEGRNGTLKQVQAAAGRYVESEEGSRRASVFRTGSKDEKEALFEQMIQERNKIQHQSKETLSAEDTGRLEAMNAQMVAAEVRMKGRTLTMGEQEDLATKYGFVTKEGKADVTSMTRAASASEASAEEVEDKKRDQDFRESGLGAYREKLQGAAAREELNKRRGPGGDLKLSKTSNEIIDTIQKEEDDIAKRTGGMSRDEQAASSDRQKAFNKAIDEKAGTMKLQDRKALITALAQSGDPASLRHAMQLEGATREEERLNKVWGGDKNVGGIGEAAAKSLGLNVSAGEFKGMTGVGISGALVKKLGLTGDAAITMEKDLRAYTTGVDEHGKKLSNYERGKILDDTKASHRKELEAADKERQDKEAAANDANYRMFTEMRDLQKNTNAALTAFTAGKPIADNTFKVQIVSGG